MARIYIQFNAGEIADIVEAVSQSADHWTTSRREAFAQDFATLVENELAVDVFWPSGEPMPLCAARPELFMLLKHYGVIESAL